VVGDWHGSLDVNGTKLPLAVHIQQGADGKLTGTMDSPNQGAIGLPIGEVSMDAGVLTVTVPQVQGSYAGKWDAETGRWRGEWRQGGAALPLDFEAGLLPASAVTPPPPLPENWTIPADAEIARLIGERNAARAGQGMVVGVLEPGGQRVIAGGPAGVPAFDGSSLFEIGSITKVFTALLLADMANKGEVSLDDPAAKYLPAGHRMPERGGRQITLRDLSQHVSGLPRLADNMPYGDPEDPYADYTEELLLAFLDGYELTRDIGAQFEYSNFGVGLLGYLLARVAGKDYETLLAERITGPLGMRDTVVTLPRGAHVVPGFDSYMRPAKPWNKVPANVAAGGIRSTANDLLRFAGAVIDPQSPIADAVRTAVANRSTVSPTQALGWQVWRPGQEGEILTHGGATGGYRSALFIEHKRGNAVVVLVNSGVEPSADDFALHLMVGARLAPLQPVPAVPPPPVARTEVALPIAELDRVVGAYDYGDGIQFITREGTVMRSARAGVPTLQIFPEAPLQFFFKAINAQLRFTTDDSGKVTGVTFTQPGGLEASGNRIEP
jgi:CubicO group peptidase (beta-lactamase class C family)